MRAGSECPPTRFSTSASWSWSGPIRNQPAPDFQAWPGLAGSQSSVAPLLRAWLPASPGSAARGARLLGAAVEPRGERVGVAALTSVGVRAAPVVSPGRLRPLRGGGAIAQQVWGRVHRRAEMAHLEGQVGAGLV